ncbi:phenylacetate--CoA ligase family protein [Paenibacillus lutrae]|uniref:phenylacetate--CoA ligase family protein n=1 Tax=Paenibacillus lutrae TaxID=2078573 RepID=UPI0012FA9549|nr:AMP-binding protein [Paenibacillus lutrae]
MAIALKRGTQVKIITPASETNEDRFEPHIRWFQDLNGRGLSIENLSRSEVEAYHRRVLWSLLQHASETNPFYEQRLKEAGLTPEEASDPEFFARLSFLTKEDLRGNPQAIVCNPNLAHIHTSTGTTGGKPIYIGHTLNDLYRLDVAPNYPSLMQDTKGTVVGNALPYEMSSSGLSFHRVFQVMQECTVLPLGKGGAYSQPDKALECMLAWNIKTLVIAPSYAVTLAEKAHELGIDLHRDFKLCHLFLTGEGASPALRERIERLWNCPATTLYGSLEVGLIGIECLQHEGFHLTEGHVYAEIVHPATGVLLKPGATGEIVLTSLLRDGMPVIRYKTGDLGYIEEDPCQCGCKLRRLHLRGRLGDQIKLRSGPFSPLYLEQHLLQLAGVGNWYRLIIENGELLVEAEMASPDLNPQLLTAEIEAHLGSIVGQKCSARIVDRVERDAGKARRVHCIY